MNPETRLCWHPLLDKLNDLRKKCIVEGAAPPHWDRVENIAGAGTPDLSWAWGDDEGHIELKYRTDWPVHDDTPVTLDTINPHQRLWWRMRSEAGGRIHVLLRIAEEYLLFEGRWAAMNLGRATQEQLRSATLYSCPREELNAIVLLGSTLRGER